MSFFWPKRPSSSRVDPAVRTSGFGARRLAQFATRRRRWVLATRIEAFTATVFVVLAASLLVIAPAQAAPGDLDVSFSGDGTLVTDFGDVTGPDIAIQDDGRIVAVGRAGSDFALARYNPDGSLDRRLGDGKLTTDFGGSDQPAASSSRRTTRSWWRAGRLHTTSRWPATTPTARSTRRSRAMAN